MNQNPPKPILDALARQMLSTDHPSADVLTAFAENALAGKEYRRIADHLARCSECREVVFLASGAADNPLQAEEGLAAARAPRRWTLRLVWGGSIAAVLGVASALILWRSESAPPRMQMASKAVGTPAVQPMQQAPESRPPTAESNPAIVPQTTAELAAPPLAVAKPQSRAARAKPVSPKAAETLGVGSSAGIVAGASPGPAKTATTPPSAETTTIAMDGAAPKIEPAAPHANSFAATQGGPLTAAPGSASAVLVNPQMTVRSVRAMHPQWRITADGHLEHLTAEGWTRVLADHSAPFRVVSVVGDHVWVGGSGGALFHSRDEGQNWEEVALTTPNGRETTTIVSIQFDDAQHGTVSTDSGTRCSTTDGGGSWSCQ